MIDRPFTFPVEAEAVTPPLLTEVISDRYPDAIIDRFDVAKAMRYGDGMVSTAGRIAGRLHFREGTPTPPFADVILKIGVGAPGPNPLYANETRFYTRLRDEIDIEVPGFLGGGYDPDTGEFGLVLEDLTKRGATFPNATTSNSLEDVRRVLDLHARLHARYWESPRFATDLAWIERHVEGDICTYFNAPDGVVGHIEHQVEIAQFKQEMLQAIGIDLPRLLAGVQAVQRHQATLPNTLLHGDGHIGNSYLLADGAGLLDWQLMVRGYCMHDVNYLITTALPVAVRRAEEMELLRYYRDQLIAAGCKSAPSFEDLHLEYRRALVWGVYIGWLTTPVVNYGWEICVANHIRLMTAFHDHETGRLVAELT